MYVCDSSFSLLKVLISVSFSQYLYGCGILLLYFSDFGKLSRFCIRVVGPFFTTDANNVCEASTSTSPNPFWCR